MKGYALHLFITLLTINSVNRQVNAESVLNWIWGVKEEKPVVISDGVPLISIPYEMMTEDEKFLKEAAKLVTDIQISSPLEICQHKVVMKIKTSCSSMTEEQLAKLSVNLLNCQSATEGRKVFPCSDDMTIKECTTNMDPDTWNAYHLMSNRARAVCYASRSHQFRALTELTVNKLMQSAHSQIETLASLKESQDRLEEQTIDAQKIMESNIQDLTNEKALIRAGHQQLAVMAEDIQRRLENASQSLWQQAAERDENHFEILRDLDMIQEQSQLLWDKIESSTNRIIEQNLEAAMQYEETMMKLEKINKTIVYVYNLTNTMRSEIDRKLGWITEYIGSTGENLEKVYRIALHVIYLLGAMIVAAFLQAPFLTRSAILGVVPLNLASYLKHGLNACLDFISLSVLIVLITAMHYLMNGIQSMIRSRCENSKTITPETSFTNGKAVFNGNGKIHNDDVERRTPETSLIYRILQNIKNRWNYIYRQFSQSIDNLKSACGSMKSRVWPKSVSTEDLSCSYLPAKKYQENIINGTTSAYPSISDDSSDYSDSALDTRRFVISDKSLTGAVLRRKTSDIYASPLTSTVKGIREPVIRETLHVLQPKKVVQSRSVTPVTRPICGAKTRSGNPCRLVAIRGQNYCHKHTSGSSIAGD